ncbi:MAG: hypothetical protein EOL97_11360 [Spirochaetia bacterium]|nr:hypothetical protein [Spirochaetia bacterium]
MEVNESSPISIGIRLEKHKFEACAISVSNNILFNHTFLTNIEGYESFIKICQNIEKKYNTSISISIEDSDNETNFKHLINYNGFNLIVLNTLKYKKNNSENDALKIAQILSQSV